MARIQKHTHNVQYLLLFHGKDGYANVPQCYSTHTAHLAECHSNHHLNFHNLLYLLHTHAQPLCILLLLLLQSALQLSVGFWPAQRSLSLLSRKFSHSAVASNTSNPQLGGPVIRTFQLSPQGTTSV